MNTYLKLKGDNQFSKNSELVAEVKKWVDAQYEDGRVTVMTDDELLKKLKDYKEDLKDQVVAKDKKLQDIGYKAYAEQK